MQQQNPVTLTIDGREVSVPPGTTILHAAEKLGIEIPTFCYSKKMAPLGACRMCLVAVERTKGFPPACATPVAPGMVVHTVTPEVVKTQQGILEFLLINHPLDCPICDKGGECPLQNLTFKYGPGKSRYTEEKRHFEKHLAIGPRIVLDRERCIVCQLCVRYMEDVADDPQLVLMNRGGKTEVNVFPDRPFDSIFAGNTTELCPVGALTSREYRFRARPWDLEHTPSVCPGCAVGCNVRLDTRRNALMRLMIRENLDVDDGWLCDVGRYGTLERLRLGERITSPLIRRNGRLVEASWEEALRAAAQGLRQAGPAGVAALAGPRATNEEYYLLGRLFRSVLRSANMLVPRCSPAPTAVLGGGAIASLETADAIVLVDADPVARQHVLDLRIKKQGKRREVPLVILSAEKTGLDYLCTAKAPLNAGNPAESIYTLLSLLHEADADPGDPPGAPPAAAAAGDMVGGVQITPPNSEAASIGAAKSAASLPAAETPNPFDQAVAVLRHARNGVVLYDERLMQGRNDRDLLATLQALSSRIAPLLEGGGAALPLALAAGANTRGATEMGAHGEWLAGGATPSDSASAAKLGQAWGSQPVAAIGHTESDLYAAIAQGGIQALYILDLDPLADAVPEAMAAIGSKAFKVVQASRTSAATASADVVLPCATYGEEPGTLTNTEGRVQRVHSALTLPDDVREGWRVVCEVARALGGDFRYVRSEEVTQEIARVTGLESWAGLIEQAVQKAAVGGVR